MKTPTKSTKTWVHNINKGRTFWLHGIHQNTTNLGLGNDKEVKKSNIPNQAEQEKQKRGRKPYKECTCIIKKGSQPKIIHRHK